MTGNFFFFLTVNFLQRTCIISMNRKEKLFLKCACYALDWSLRCTQNTTIQFTFT